MGTDIHLIFQRKENDVWVDIPGDFNNWDRLGGRNYQLFAVLAGVRNGTGFAGVKTGEAVEPIARPRGLPKDFQVEDGEYHGPVERTGEGEIIDGFWMGYHDHSWLLGSEMCTWYANAPVVTQTGVIDRAEYLGWDKVSCPESYSGSVWGQGLKTAVDRPGVLDDPTVTHVQVSWKMPLHDQLRYFFNEVMKLIAMYGEVRLVFGFDS